MNDLGVKYLQSVDAKHCPPLMLPFLQLFVQSFSIWSASCSAKLLNSAWPQSLATFSPPEIIKLKLSKIYSALDFDAQIDELEWESLFRCFDLCFINNESDVKEIDQVTFCCLLYPFNQFTLALLLKLF